MHQFRMIFILAPISMIGCQSYEQAGHAQLDYAGQCHTLAAHKSDPFRAIPSGVSDEDLAAKAAIQACSMAVETQVTPANRGQLYFQLGRGYAALNNENSAIESFNAAVEADYPPAYAMLVPYIIPTGDTGLARKYLQHSLSHGFSPAKEMMAQLDEWIARNYLDESAVTQIIGCLNRHDFECLDGLPPTEVAVYMDTLFTYLHSDLYRFTDDACFVLVDATSELWGIPWRNFGSLLLKKLNEMKATGDWTPLIESFINGFILDTTIGREAAKDLQYLVSTQGCGSPIMKKIINNAMEYLKVSLAANIDTAKQNTQGLNVTQEETNEAGDILPPQGKEVNP